MKAIIETPKPNPQSRGYASYSRNDFHAQELLKDEISYQKIKPKTHQKALDLCSGDGAIAWYLTTLGWEPEDITCIDQFRSTRPLVRGVRWKFIDLDVLLQQLQHGEQVEPEIASLEHSFDVVTMFWGLVLLVGVEGSTRKRLLTDYFKKPGGFSYIYGT